MYIFYTYCSFYFFGNKYLINLNTNIKNTPNSVNNNYMCLCKYMFLNDFYRRKIINIIHENIAIK